MGILISGETRVLVQGISGKEGSFWTERMLAMGTRIVAGVTPGKEGQRVHGVPVYNTVRRAVAEQGAEASVLFVPPAFALDAACEAIDAGLRLVVLLTDGIPMQDTLVVKTFALQKGVRVIGPNTPGIATVGQAVMGFIPVWLDDVYRPGHVGVLSRSGSLVNEVASHVFAAGLGISSVVGLGGDATPCTRSVEILRLFAVDPDTHAVVMLGELGGSMEEEAAEFIRSGGLQKPVVSFIAGASAPPGKKMGHAGAILANGYGSVAGKNQVLREAGVLVAERPSQVGELLRAVL